MTSIADLVTDDNLLGPWFSGPSWANWKLVLRATFGEPLLGYERRRFRELAERNPPPGRVREAFFAIGRRGGKDSVASAIAVHAAVFGDYQQHLRPGERAVVLLLANTKDQASDLLRYIAGYFDGRVPMLTPLVQRITDDTLELTTGVDIIVHSANYRSLRGKTIAVVILDELAFWRDESGRFVNPDREIYSSVLPALVTLRKAGSILIGISSVHRKVGLLFDRCAKYLGKDDPHVLAIKAPSQTFNSTIPDADIAADLELDPEKGRAEWFSEWRTDLTGFVSHEVVEAIIDRGVHERAYDPAIHYVACTDESGGSGGDSSTFAIAHTAEDGRIVQDLLRIWRPDFRPSQVIAEKAALMKAWHIREVTGDRWASGIPGDLYEKNGIRYEKSAKVTNDIYVDFLHLANSHRVVLLDNPVQKSELLGLERKVSFGGKEIIGHHAYKGHDDAINACAGACVLAATEPARLIISDETLRRSRLPASSSRYGGDPRRIPLIM